VKVAAGLTGMLVVSAALAAPPDTLPPIEVHRTAG